MIKRTIKFILISILTLEARVVVWKYRPKIIGVTGNAGKTGTKEAIAAVLGSDFSVWKNEKSYNSDIGIPLTILHCQNAWSNIYLWVKNILEGLILILLRHNYPEWLVLEVGADRPGDIKKFISWIRPEMVVVTRIGETPVHVENFSSRDELIKEKMELVKALRPGGYLILNADDPDVLRMKDMVLGAQVVTFGFSPKANLRASNYHIAYNEVEHVKMPCGIGFRIDYVGNVIPIRVSGIIGRHNVYSALAACAVGISLRVNFIIMAEAVAKYERPVGRLKLLEGINNSIILDDTYNSSPAAVSLALESLADIDTSGKKFIVLGDMLELGKHTMNEHLSVGKKVSQYGDVLITVGQRAKHIAQGARESGMDQKNILCFSDPYEAGLYLKEKLSPGDIVLIKGSQGMRMERVVEEILARRDQKKLLLARQDEEWLKR
ncbi:MAG: UDP-N-acetylmuramoyl-tripeptide--D-alanyl-D-alanine ligase [Candidatus Vogelbacteria bacterium]|nr:UDP-N-acetylmuramoyl-tripeptide--D-alanyl-D-alanine ligase [Candidatus Vogelbacteria bacterium]